MSIANIPILSASFESSTNLTEAEYDPFMQVLSLKFRNGSMYDYLNVKQEVFEQLTKAPSAGQYFHSKIRGKYEFLKKVPMKKSCKTETEVTKNSAAPEGSTEEE